MPGAGEGQKTAQGEDYWDGLGQPADLIVEVDWSVSQRALDDIETDRAKVMPDPPMFPFSINMQGGPAMEQRNVETFIFADGARNRAQD